MTKQSFYLKVILALLLGLIATGAILSTNQLISYIVTAAINSELQQLIILFSIQAGLIILFCFSYLIGQFFITAVTRSMAQKVKQRYINSIDYATPQESAMVSMLVVKAERVIERRYKNLFGLTSDAFGTVFVIAFTFAQHWVAGLVVLTALVITFVFGQIGNKKGVRINKDLAAAATTFTNTVTSSVDGYMTYAFAGKEKTVALSANEAIKQFHQATLKSERAEITKDLYSGSAFRVMSFIVSLVLGVVVLYQFTTPGIMVMALATSAVSISLAQGSAASYASLRTNTGVYKEFLSLDQASTNLKRDVQGDISIKDLTFTYPGQLIFKNLSGRVLENSKVLIIGKSGVGKSTLVKLLSGSLLPTSGAIYFGEKLIDGPVVSPSLKIVNNEFAFFDVALADAISSFKTKEHAEQVKVLTNFFGLEGVTPLTASKGELQKIKLANMLCEGASYQIYDEPFSNIDKVTMPKAVELVLNQSHKTVIVIAHNLPKSLQQKFDQVIKL